MILELLIALHSPLALPIRMAAIEHNVSPNTLASIAWTESRLDPSAKRKNANNTVDVGLFQINSVHWHTTCKKYDVFTIEGNARCAGLLLSKHKLHAKSDPNWVGRYHSKTQSRKKAYVKLLSANEIKFTH